VGHDQPVGTRDRGGGGIPALRPHPLRLTPGVAPFLAACALGGWDSATGLADRSHRGNGIALCFLGLLVTLGAAGFLAACVLQRTSRAAPVGVLVVAATYLVPVLSGRGGPWSAGVMGVALVGLAWLTQADLRRQRRLPTQPLHWTWRSALALACATSVLDVAVAFLGDGSHRYHLAPLAVLVAGVTSTGLLALLALLAAGRPDRSL
jgi:hypothetical protein